MKLNLMNLLYALSDALDMVEHDLIGVQSSHGKHVAYFSYLMAKRYGMRGKELEEFVGCALLHDNAFTEYAREEFNGGAVVDSAELRKRVELLTGSEYMNFISGSQHSVTGEENIRLLPFKTNVRNTILYHHENADGSGPLGMRSEETTFKSQIVHIADTLDVTSNVMTMTEEEFKRICRAMKMQSGTFFSRESINLFLQSVTYQDIDYLQDKTAELILREELPSKQDNYTDEEIKNISAFFAKIADCKSSFVKNHSIGVAEKVEAMAKYYGFSKDKTIRLYLAGALHDIGKLVIDNDVLEKNGKLSENEFRYVKNHAEATYRVLVKTEGLEDITKWASRHHEKLDGSGYPFGLSGRALSIEDRLMTCADIYQALTEPRPYKDAFSHEKAIEIMIGMADDGKIDKRIVEDMDICFG